MICSNFKRRALSGLLDNFFTFTHNFSIGADDLSEKFNDEDLADYLEQDLEDHSNLSEVSPSDLRSVLIQSQVDLSP